MELIIQVIMVLKQDFTENSSKPELFQKKMEKPTAGYLT